MMSVDLHKTDYGTLLETIPAKRTVLLIKAAISFVAAAICLFFIFQTPVAQLLAQPRLLLPLLLPAAMLLMGVHALFGSGKRVEIYEQGLIYRTPLFCLDTPYEQVTGMRVTKDCRADFVTDGNAPPLTIRFQKLSRLTMTLEDGREWQFYGNTYADLYEKGQALYSRWISRQQQVSQK